MESMATSGGPHSAAQWARITVGQLIQIAPSANSEQANEARHLAETLVEILEDCHEQVQQHERQLLRDLGVDRPIDPRAHVEIAMKNVNALIERTPFREFFAQQFVQDNMRETLGQHFATSID